MTTWSSLYCIDLQLVNGGLRREACEQPPPSRAGMLDADGAQQVPCRSDGAVDDRHAVLVFETLDERRSGQVRPDDDNRIYVAGAALHDVLLDLPGAQPPHLDVRLE